MKFSGVIAIDRCDVHAKGQGQRSKVKVTEVMSPLSRFWTVTPVWIHIWWRNDAQSLMLLRRSALLFFKVNRQIFKVIRLKKLSILTQVGCFRTVTPVWIHQWIWNDAQSFKQRRRGALFFQGHPSNFEVTQDKKSLILTQIERFQTVTSIKFQGHTGQKNCRFFYPNWEFPDCNSTLNALMGLKWCTKLDVV